MTWYIASTRNECFPVFMDGDKLEIPRRDPNSTFTKEGWVIKERYPVVIEGGIQWETRQFSIVGFKKMECFSDIEREIEEVSTYLGKTLMYGDKEYELTLLKRNDVRGGYFLSKGDGYTEIWFNDGKAFIGLDGNWVETPIVWKN